MICKKLLCSVAVAAAGALLPLFVFAAELEDENNGLVDDLSPEVSDQESFFPSPTPGELFSDDLGESDSFPDDIFDFPTLDDSVITGDGLTDDDFLDYPFDDGSDDDFVGIDDGIDDDFTLDDGISLLSNYDTYYGSISSTYLEYMRGYLPKLGFSDHYVAARVGQYQYIFAYGDITWTGSLFTGFDVMVISWSTQGNGTFSSGIQSAFNLSPGAYLVYSDLTDIYPSLADLSAFTLRQVLLLFTIFCLVLTMIHMCNIRKVRR